MTIQSFLLLRKIKKAQRTPNDMVYVDTDDLTIVAVASKDDPRETLKLRPSFWRNHLRLSCEELSSNGYVSTFSVDLSGHHVFELTPKGRYIWQNLIANVIFFLARSIATPIIVSVLTTWFTLKLFGQI